MEDMLNENLSFEYLALEISKQLSKEWSKLVKNLNKCNLSDDLKKQIDDFGSMINYFLKYAE